MNEIIEEAVEANNRILENLPVRKLRAVVGGSRGKEFVEVLVDGDYDGEFLADLKIRTMPGGEVQVFWPKEFKNKYLHQVVMGEKKGHWIEHINGNKLDNRSANLRFVSPKEMMKKRVYIKKRGGKVGMLRATQEDFELVKALRQEGLSYRKISTQVGLGQTTIKWLAESDSLEDYRVNKNAFNRKKKGRVGTAPLLKVTPEKYKITKRLANIEALSLMQIAKRVGLSQATVHRIRHSDSLADYKASSRADSGQYTDEQVVRAENTIPVPTPSVEKLEMDLLNEKLDTIMAGLEELQVEVKRIPKRRKF